MTYLDKHYEKAGKRQKYSLLYKLCIITLTGVFFLITLSEFITIPLVPSWSALADLASGSPMLSSDAPVSVHFIDTGQSEAILVKTRQANLLIDSGDPSSQNKVLSYLEKQEVQRLDYLLLSHPHTDHMGNMTEILKRIDVGTLLMVRLPDELVPTGAFYEEFLSAASKSGTEVEAVVTGTSYNLGNASLLMLGPGYSYEDLNNSSVACKLICSDTISFLFTGDMEKESEKALLKSNRDLRATVLKVPHHGSGTSSTAPFLDAVEPSYAVICCGKDNEYGHPSQYVLTRLVERETEIYRTDRDGTVVFETDGKEIRVVKEK